MIKAVRNWLNELEINQNPQLFMTSASAVLEYAIQPIIDAYTGDVYGFEALLRNVEQLGVNTPEAIFDVACGMNCLPELELVLRRKAIEKYVSIKNRDTARLFINVDVRVLETEGFLLSETQELLNLHGLSPASVCFEVSENADPSKSELVQKFVKKSKELGFSFAIDDFGKGYSQMKSLHDLELDILKIDQFFIREIQNDGRKRLLVKAMVDLAHVLGMRVVAEGIETKAEMKICTQVGCDLLQGFLICQPFTHPGEAKLQYTCCTAVQQCKDQDLQSDEALIRREIRPLVALKDNACMDDVLKLLRAGKAYPFIPVVNTSNEPKGLIREADIKNLIYMPFGQDLLRNKSTNNNLKSFIHSCPVADIHSRLDQLVAMMPDDDETASGIIITKHGEYFGFLTTSALLKISNEIRMRIAEDQNPLTKLPGNMSVTSFVAESTSASEVERSFCYIDLDNFKPFNDIYGFRTGDRALLMFSEIMKRIPNNNRSFVGHVGGDDFFIGTKNQSIESVIDLMSKLQADFRHDAESLYDTEHREAKKLIAKDRAGVERAFPLLSCSIAILHLPRGVYVDNQELLLRQIAMLKKDAKSSKSGLAAAIFGQTTSEVPSLYQHREEEVLLNAG